MLFPLGKLYATPGAIEHLHRAQVLLLELIGRHVTGDYGNLCQDDMDMNAQAIESGERILSAYQAAGEKIYIITEADRQSTTVLLASEY